MTKDTQFAFEKTRKIHDPSVCPSSIFQTVSFVKTSTYLPKQKDTCQWKQAKDPSAVTYSHQSSTQQKVSTPIPVTLFGPPSSHAEQIDPLLFPPCRTDSFFFLPTRCQPAANQRVPWTRRRLFPLPLPLLLPQQPPRRRSRRSRCPRPSSRRSGTKRETTRPSGRSSSASSAAPPRTATTSASCCSSTRSPSTSSRAASSARPTCRVAVAGRARDVATKRAAGAAVWGCACRSADLGGESCTRCPTMISQQNFVD